MGILGTMTVNFTANTAGLASGINQAKSNISGFAENTQTGAKTVLAGFAIVGAAAIGAGIAATKMAGDFQAGMTTLVTGAGESSKNIGMVSNGILDLAVKTGTSTKQLTDGMYMIESAGYRGADGLNVLKVAAEGAKVGNADLGVTANALTTMMTDYHMKSSQAAEAMNGLTATVGNGKTVLQLLGNSMGNVLPIASSLGISFPQVAGAMATMTNSGISAQRASQNLASVLTNLSAPGAAAQKAMKSVGLSAQQVKDTLTGQGLPAALQLIETHIGEKFPAGSVAYNSALKAVMGGLTGLKLDAATGGASLSTLENNVNAVSTAMKNGGTSVTGWSQVQGTFNQKLDQAKEAFETTGIKIGTALLPAVGRLLSALSSPGFQSFAQTMGNVLVGAVNGLATALNFIIPVIGNVVHFFQQHQAAMVALQAILVPVAGVLGGLLVAALVSVAVAAWAAVAPFLAFAAPFILIGAIVAVVIAGIVLAVQHWGQIVSWLQGIWSAFSGWFMGLLGGLGAWFTGLWNGIIGGLKAAWGGVSGFFTGLWSGIIGGLQAAWNGIAAFFTGLWNGIVSGIQTAWNTIVNIVRIGALTILSVIMGPFLAIGELFVWLYNHNTYFKELCDNIVNFFKAALAWLQSAWTNTVNFLSGLWNGIANTARTVWNAITSAIMAVVNTVISWLQMIWNREVQGLTVIWNTLSGIASAAWNAVSSAVMSVVNTVVGWLRVVWFAAIAWLGSVWSTLSGLAQTAWNGVVGVFEGVWGSISGALSSLWNNISNWFSNLANQALTWGKNLIQGFINGILGMLGAVGNAASQIAGKVASFLGFHSPAKEGPGNDADTWAPNFINMYASGIEAGIPKIKAAMQKLSTPLATNLKVQTTAYPAGTSNSSAAVLAAVASSASAANQGQIIENHIYIDGKEVTAKLGPHIANAIRAQGAIRSR